MIAFIMFHGTSTDLEASTDQYVLTMQFCVSFVRSCETQLQTKPRLCQENPTESFLSSFQLYCSLLCAQSPKNGSEQFSILKSQQQQKNTKKGQSLICGFEFELHILFHPLHVGVFVAYFSYTYSLIFFFSVFLSEYYSY